MKNPPFHITKEKLENKPLQSGESAQIENAPKFHKDLTQGSVLKKMILFSLPILLSNLLQALYNMGDMFMIGLFDGTADAAAAVNEGGQITLFVTNIIVGFCMGGTVLIAQYIGLKKYGDIKETIGTVFTVLLIAAAVLTILMIALAPVFVRLMGVPQEAVKGTVAYVMICMAGNIFAFGYNGISAVLRGMGDSVRPLIIVGGACLLNLGLDALFIGPLGMGVPGAALATVLAQAAAMLAAVIYLYKKKFVFDFKFKSFKIRKEKLKSLLKVGLPVAVLNAVNSLSFIFLLTFVNKYGADAAAGAGIASKINGLAILPIFAIGMSVTAMSAQNISAGFYKRAYHTMFVGIGAGIVLGAAVFTLSQIFAPSLIKLFLLKEQTDYNQTEAVRLGAEYLRAFSFDYIMVVFFVTLSGLINGAERTGISMVFSVCSAILVRVPLAYILNQIAGLGFRGIAFGAPIATTFTTVLCLIYILTGKWKMNGRSINDTVILELS